MNRYPHCNVFHFLNLPLLWNHNFELRVKLASKFKTDKDPLSRKTIRILPGLFLRLFRPPCLRNESPYRKKSYSDLVRPNDTPRLRLFKGLNTENRPCKTEKVPPESYDRVLFLGLHFLGLRVQQTSCGVTAFLLRRGGTES